MSNLSEEAILYLEHTAEDDFNLEDYQRHNRYLAIKTILDLYNKEKERNMNLDLENIGLKENRRIAVEEIQEEYYISKDKIREKIESRKQRLIKGKISYTNKIRLNELNNLEKTLLEE